MIDAKLISMLRCPIDGSQLAIADGKTLDRVNDAIQRGEVRDRADQKISNLLEGGLVTVTSTRVYPIRGSIPSLVADEAIDLSTLA